VFALYFQSGLGYTPLQSGLAVTAFAIGSAGSAVIGGRLVARLGRRLTVLGLSLVVLGMGTTAVVIWLTPPELTGWAVAVPLFVGGVGGGWVVAPNTTMTLRCVPVRMAGSAGGALQTGQRIGAAIGTSALPGVFYAVLAGNGRNFPAAAAVAIGSAAVAVCVALAIGVYEWRHAAHRASAAPDSEAPDHAHFADAH
jgi:MFS family permease